jgi:gliding motility-associated-like protein
VPGICKGGSFLLPTTSTNGYIGNWNPPINNNDTTTYTFIPNVGQCATTTTMTVGVTTKPTVAPITGPSVVAIDQTITLKNDTIGGIWLSTPPTLASINSVGEVKGILPGTVTIKYGISNICGHDTAYYSVQVFPPEVFIPNLFTPNGDGKNDLFYVRGSDFMYPLVELKIFDSWGSIIFESKGKVDDKSIAWDGKSKGKVQPSGVYIYLIKLLTKNGETIVKKGSISLMR